MMELDLQEIGEIFTIKKVIVNNSIRENINIKNTILGKIYVVQLLWSRSKNERKKTTQMNLEIVSIWKEKVKKSKFMDPRNNWHQSEVTVQCRMDNR